MFSAACIVRRTIYNVAPRAYSTTTTDHGDCNNHHNHTLDSLAHSSPLAPIRTLPLCLVRSAPSHMHGCIHLLLSCKITLVGILMNTY